MAATRSATPAPDTRRQLRLGAAARRRSRPTPPSTGCGAACAQVLALRTRRRSAVAQRAEGDNALVARLDLRAARRARPPHRVRRRPEPGRRPRCWNAGLADPAPGVGEPARTPTSCATCSECGRSTSPATRWRSRRRQGQRAARGARPLPSRGDRRSASRSPTSDGWAAVHRRRLAELLVEIAARYERSGRTGRAGVLGDRPATDRQRAARSGPTTTRSIVAAGEHG